MKPTEQLMVFFPTTIMIIDDNESFLDSLKITLGKKFNIITCTDLDEAYNILNTSELNNDSNEIFELKEEENHDNAIIELKIKNLLNYRKNKNPIISTVIIDYLFTDKNSIEFCESIKHLNVRKILLTANATNEVAIKAFNDGLIDKFLQKHTKNLLDILSESINLEQDKFFQFLNDSLWSGIKSKNKLPLFSAEFKYTFNEIKTKYNIIEYYLLDFNGSYLLIDKYNNTKIFACLSDEIFKNYIEVAKEEGASEDIVQPLQTREKLIFFYGENNYHVAASQWDDYMYDSKKINEQLFYSIIDEVKEKYPILNY